MSDVAILIPSYGRIDRLEAVVANARDATPGATVVLLLEPDEHAAVIGHGGIDGAVAISTVDGFGTYAKAINCGYRNTAEPLLFAGADDLRFHHGWLDAALATMKATGAQVVGTNDLGNPEVLAGDHATHYLVKRGYLDAVGGVFDQGPGSFMPDCYDHNWTDREFIATAQHRGVFAPCLDAVVEHCHPAWGKAEMDSTYRKSFREESADAALAHERMAAMRATAPLTRPISSVP